MFDVVDVAFTLEGTSLPSDFRLALWQALVGALPWLVEESRVAPHPVRVVETDYGVALLPKRSKLTIRAPADLAQELLRLEGSRLEIGESWLKVGSGKVWKLPHVSTLFANFVTTGERDESLFCHDIENELEKLGVSAQLICGRASTLTAGGQQFFGFPLALHSVPRAGFNRLLQSGLGRQRHLGCGVLVQHKAITGLD